MGHGKHAIEIFEHLGIPVLVHHLGRRCWSAQGFFPNFPTV